MKKIIICLLCLLICVNVFAPGMRKEVAPQPIPNMVPRYAGIFKYKAFIEQSPLFYALAPKNEFKVAEDAASAS